MDYISWSAVRSIPTKEKGNRGFFPSKKVPEGIVEYESQLERDFFLLCEHNPSVKRFQHQPITITYKSEKGKYVTYTPDAYVEFIDNQNYLIEIKDEINEKVLNNNSEKWDAAKEWGEENNTKFTVLTSHEIRTARMANIWFTLGASKCKDNRKYIKKLNILLSSYGEKGRRYNKLCQDISQEFLVKVGKASQILCYAIFHGLVFVDTFSSEALSNKTVIRKKKNNKQPFSSILEEINQSFSNQVKSETDHQHKYKKILRTLSDQRVPERYQHIVEKREKIVKAWLNQPPGKRTKDWRLKFILSWKKITNLNISESTIYNWIKKYNEYGIEGLIPTYKKRGSYFPKETQKLMEKARKRYLKPNKTMEGAYIDLIKDCQSRELPPPSLSTFRKFIYNSSDASERALLRKGRRYHKSHFSPALTSFQGAIMPMQVLQLDNTEFDVFSVDNENREPLSTLNLTAAIDCYSGMITGIYLSYEPWNSQNVLETLVQSILNKDTYVRTYETLEWDIQGFPTLILVDNGMDYRAKDIKRFCLEYDIILEYVPLRNPRYKAFIESWFKILNNTLKKEIHNGFRPSLKERRDNPDLKAKSSAVHTLQKLESWLYMWITDEYHYNNPYSNHVLAPFLRYDDARNGQTKTILPAPREAPREIFKQDILLINTLKQLRDLTLTDRGVQWEYLKYNNKELGQLYKRIGKIKVKVLQDRRDIRHMWVISPLDEKPIQVGLGSGWASVIAEIHDELPINASAWIREVRWLKENNIKRITPYNYQRTRLREKRRALLEKSKRESKKIRREKERTRESKRRRIGTRLQSYQFEEKVKSHREKETDSLNIKKKEKRRKKIDWDEIGQLRLPTSEFPEDR